LLIPKEKSKVKSRDASADLHKLKLRTAGGVLPLLMNRTMITTRLSQGARFLGISGRCAMFFRNLPSRFFRIVLVVLSLSTLTFAASHAQPQSAKAGIFLHAVLVQSLSMNVTPEPTFVNSFIASSEVPKFPVTIKTNWVRGTATISIAVLASQDFQSWRHNQMLSIVDPSQKNIEQPVPEYQFNSMDLQVSEDENNKVLTIRAQAL
jgi:hypothetical protein